MKKLVVSFFAFFTFAIAHADDAANTGYIELGVSSIRYEGGGAWAQPGLANLKLGFNANKNISFELLGATTINEAHVGAVSFRVDSLFGLYLKAKTDLTENLDIFGRFGVARNNVSVSGPGGYAWAYDTSVSFGAGLDYNFTKNFYGQIDYMSYYMKDGTSAFGPSVSLGVKF